MDEYMTVTEASEMFGVDRTTVYHWMKSQGMPSMKVGGKRLFKRSWLEHWGHGRTHRGMSIVETPFGVGKFVSENGDWVTVEIGFKYLVTFERKDVKFVSGVVE